MTPAEACRLRIEYAARIVKDACEGKTLPPGVNKSDWITYNQAAMIEDLARLIVETTSLLALAGQEAKQP
jgi:hypothetical protein